MEKLISIHKVTNGYIVKSGPYPINLIQDTGPVIGSNFVAEVKETVQDVRVFKESEKKEMIEHINLQLV